MVQMVNIMLCVFSPNKVSICKSKHIHWLWLYILSIIPTGRHNWPVTWNKIPEKRQTVASCASDELTSLPISFTAPFSTKESRLEYPWMGAENQENKDGGGEWWRHRREGNGTGAESWARAWAISPFCTLGSKDNRGHWEYRLWSQTCFKSYGYVILSTSFLVFCWFVLAPKSLGFPHLQKELATIHNSWCFVRIPYK